MNVWLMLALGVVIGIAVTGVFSWGLGHRKRR